MPDCKKSDLADRVRQYSERAVITVLNSADCPEISVAVGAGGMPPNRAAGYYIQVGDTKPLMLMGDEFKKAVRAMQRALDFGEGN
jgi:hypothetical protein